MSDWRNMDTAPKDGTRVLMGCWRDGEFLQFFGHWIERWDVWGGDCCERYGLNLKPECWHPLLHPPTRIPKPQSELPKPEDLRGLFTQPRARGE